MPLTKHVSLRLKEGASEEQGEQIIGDLHSRFLVSIGGTGPYGVIPVESGKLEEIADFLRNAVGVAAESVKIEE